ncbi:ABC transporter A family member 7-like isoform X2 [Nymphaea colorata]|uniref:ABC transporter A family member 7-like isoform X2 n=1 Tax=Nymphaea colorata TaxID=210225 RepID=UPI00214F5329|nr:ABC transporter A family member 7-like isoform X2 [Nymphaea colorata]
MGRRGGDGRAPASFWCQADALLRKNLTFQRRNVKQILSLVMFPALLCGLIVGVRLVVNSQLDNHKYKCGCKCIDKNGSGSCQYVCGIEYSNTSKQALACAIRRPKPWPAFLQLPIQNGAVEANASSTAESPHGGGSSGRTSPVTILFTGQNRPVATRLMRKLNVNNFPNHLFDLMNPVSRFYLGTSTRPGPTNFLEPALVSNSSLYVVLPSCLPNSSFSFSVPVGSNTFKHEVICVRGLYSWRDNSSEIDREMEQIRKKHKNSLKILASFDLLNSNRSNFNVTVRYDSTYRSGDTNPRLLRIPRSINMISDGFLQLFGGRGCSMKIDFVKEMPKHATKISFDVSSLLGPLVFAWVIQLLFPVILMSLVYEKQHKLRIMMKMHGLGDGPYWLISYCYYLFLSTIYVILFAVFGCLIVVGNMYVFGSGLLGAFLFQSHVEDQSYPKWRIVAMETMPGFSLYRGVYELVQYSLEGHYKGTWGMSWKNLSDNENGMKIVLIIMAAEWLILLPITYYLDQISFLGRGNQNPLYLIRSLRSKLMKPFARSSTRVISRAFVDLEKFDVCGERDVVQQLVNEPSRDFPIVCHNLRKVYKGKDGNPVKHAVQNVSLAVPRGECFGLLGPNGSGKTTFINMVTGNLSPTSGTAFIDGLNIQTDMDKIYMRMGFCPQYDLIWETLTGREHLLFYARLKNFKGSKLQQVVDQSLKTVNLFGVGDRLAGKYSGGMKRRLSVAIALIGDPQVVYLDEPTTGLDPDSRNYLWNVIKQAKKSRAVILTTHSMEEAEYLCDRLGIIVKGNLQCLGSSKELRSRYGGSYLLTVSTDPMQEAAIEDIIRGLSPNALAVYRVSGTLKFRLPKSEVRVCDVFQAMQIAKQSILVHAFGLADSSLEEVFFEVVNETLGITS